MHNKCMGLCGNLAGLSTNKESYLDQYNWKIGTKIRGKQSVNFSLTSVQSIEHVLFKCDEIPYRSAFNIRNLAYFMKCFYQFIFAGSRPIFLGSNIRFDRQSKIIQFTRGGPQQSVKFRSMHSVTPGEARQRHANYF